MGTASIVGVTGIALIFAGLPDPQDEFKGPQEPAAAAAQADSSPTVELPRRVQHFPVGDSVKSIACTADGKLIAVTNGNPTFPLRADGKRSVEILDAESGKTVVALELSTGEEDAVLAATEGLPHFETGPLAFSPDGKVLAVGTGIGQVKLFHVPSGKLLIALDDEEGKLAEQQTPEKLKAIARAMGGVGSLAFSPDGSLLATTGTSFDDRARGWGGILRLGQLATGPGRLKVWDARTGELKHDLVGFSHAEMAAFSSDGSLLACAGRWSGADHGTGVIVWELQTGKKRTTILKEANGGTHVVAFSPNKKLLVIGSRMYDKENDTSSTAISVAYALSGITEWQRTIPGWAIPKAFTPDGKRIAVLCAGKSIQFLNAETGKTEHEIRPADKPPRSWNDFAIAPQAGILVVGGSDADKHGLVTVRGLEGEASE